MASETPISASAIENTEIPSYKARYIDVRQLSYSTTGHVSVENTDICGRSESTFQILSSGVNTMGHKDIPMTLAQ